MTHPVLQLKFDYIKNRIGAAKLNLLVRMLVAYLAALVVTAFAGTTAAPMLATYYIRNMCSLLTLLFVSGITYVLTPDRGWLSAAFTRSMQVRAQLNPQQQLYLNAVLVTICAGLGYAMLDAQFHLFLILGTLGFYGYIVAYDFARWHAAMAANRYGVAVIGLVFAAASSATFALAKQHVALALGDNPVNALHTTMFVAIMMIPVIIMWAAGILFLLGVMVMVALLLPWPLPRLSPAAKLFLFAGTLPNTQLRYAFLTRLCQAVLFAVVGATLGSAGSIMMPWYQRQIVRFAPTLVFELDMYPSKVCQLKPGYKALPLGDATFLIAQRDAAGTVVFEPLGVKCDTLPTPPQENIGASANTALVP